MVGPRPEDGGSGDTAVIAFGIKVMPFDEQKELIDAIRAEIDPPGTENDPPAGVSAEVVGLPVLAADANAELGLQPLPADARGAAGGRAGAARRLPLAAAGARAADPDRRSRPAGRRSALAIVGVPLNPMSATLGRS